MNYTRTGLGVEQQAELCLEQKAEIERLEAENEKYRKKPDEIINMLVEASVCVDIMFDVDRCGRACKKCWEIALGVAE